MAEEITTPAGRRSRLLLLALPIVFFAALGALFLVLLLDEKRDPRALPSSLVGQPAPTLAMPALRLGEADLGDDVVGGRPILVNFFASWCVACRAEMPMLVELAESQGVEIVGVDYKDDPADGLLMLERYGDPYARAGVDRTGRIGLEWGIYGIPETFVIDAEGIVALRHAGALDLRTIEDRILPALEGRL